MHQTKVIHKNDVKGLNFIRDLEALLIEMFCEVSGFTELLEKFSILIFPAFLSSKSEPLEPSAILKHMQSNLEATNEMIMQFFEDAKQNGENMVLFCPQFVIIYYKKSGTVAQKNIFKLCAFLN